MVDMSIKPYLLRAIHTWCIDMNYAPYITVLVDERVKVPDKFVLDNKIVLNISYNATDQLQIKNEYITFNTRFNGTLYGIEIPMRNVLAIYSKETRQGITFQVSEIEVSDPCEYEDQNGLRKPLSMKLRIADRSLTETEHIKNLNIQHNDCRTSFDPYESKGKSHLKITK